MKAKKSLGQNFLKSQVALRKMVEAGEVRSDDLVLEIGPGKGALTEKLLATGCQLLAVEKDDALFEFLKIKFEKEIATGQLKLARGDILDFEFKSYKLLANSYKLISNIPYNITGAILKKFLAGERQPERMVLLVQKEVAERIVARNKQGLLSISVKVYGTPKMLLKVPARYFSPSPKVDSAIIAITDISKKLFNSPLEEYPLGGGGRIYPPRPDPGRGTPQEGNFEQKFWQIVRAGFAHKRKKLSSNLKNLCQRDTLTGLGNKRAEDLSLEDWIELVRKIEN